MTVQLKEHSDPTFIFDEEEMILYFPACVATHYTIRSVEELLALMCSFPSLFVSALGIHVDTFEKMREELCSSLVGYVDDRFLDPPDPPEYGYGALPPKKY